MFINICCQLELTNKISKAFWNTYFNKQYFKFYFDSIYIANT